jgi:plastocyanin
VATHNVIVKNFAFDPNALEIENGETVSWKVAAGTHTVTADDNAFDSGDITSASPAFERTFDSVGEVAYHCRHHGPMKAKVTVKAAATAATVVHNVTVKNFSFSPNALEIQPGDKVVWKVESGTHTVTADDNAFNSGDMNSASPPFEQTFATAGEIPYHCNHHPAMKGKVTVKDTSPPGP